MIAPHGPFPATFGSYRVLRHVNHGGTADVYEALHTRAGDKRVALKIAMPSVALSERGRTLFLAEGNAAARLPRHNNICLIHECGIEEGTPFLSMEFLDGGRLTPTAVNDPWDAVTLVHTLALAMQTAHDAGVTHRDLKPANILFTADGVPRIADFGLALCRWNPDVAMPEAHEAAGTPGYMAPEQLSWDEKSIESIAKSGISCDIFSLGVVLFELLTGVLPLPVTSRTMAEYLSSLSSPAPVGPPSIYRLTLPHVLDDVCALALDKDPRRRFAEMREFAEALARALSRMNEPRRPVPPPPIRPRVALDRVRFVFAEVGTTAPEFSRPTDRLYLDVGNRLRAGVIDHHHLIQASGSSTSLLLSRPGLIDDAVRPDRAAGDPFVIVLHERPDLDSVASAFLASAWLADGRFPDGADALGRYVDHIDQGKASWTPGNPFTLHTAYTLLCRRMSEQRFDNDVQRWQEIVRAGFELIRFVLDESVRSDRPIDAVNAFACASVMTEEDRTVLAVDRERYKKKLADPKTAARRGTMQLPAQFGGRRSVPFLLVRDVLTGEDGCAFFRNWARTDAARSPEKKGFTATSVFMSEGPGRERRCIIAVRPEDGVTLRGLGERLDREEAEVRRRLLGEDDRLVDPVSGERRPIRPGYTNADPWYDGRAHAYTIVDAPRDGTRLTAEQIEAIFLDYGNATDVQPVG